MPFHGDDVFRWVFRIGRRSWCDQILPLNSVSYTVVDDSGKEEKDIIQEEEAIREKEEDKREEDENIEQEGTNIYNTIRMDSFLKDELLCPVCHASYCTETGDPRTLKCGHSLCSPCLQQLLANDDSICPECRSDILVPLEEIPISFTIKQIITKLNEKQEELTSPKTFNEYLEIPLPKNATEGSLPSVGICESHRSPLHFGCTQCEEWICGTCVCLYHSGDKKQCKVFQINEALRRKKDELLSFLPARLETVQTYRLEGKLCKKTVEELIDYTVKHISIYEKFLKEFSSKQLAFVEQDSYISECDELVADLSHKLNVVQSPSELKVTLDKYFDQKKFINKEKEKNNLFQIWRNWMQEVTNSLEITNKIYIKWQDWNGKSYLQRLTVEKGEVILRLQKESQEPENAKLIMEDHFFSYSRVNHLAFIEVGEREDSPNNLRITFLLDDNPLGQEFMKMCCSLKRSFKGSKIYIPGRSSGSFCFGEQNSNWRNSKKYIGIDRKQYLKPIVKGAIGIFNNFENSDTVDVNNTLIYINMDNGTPRHQNIHYIAYEEEPKLQLCFGLVQDGLEDLENQMSTAAEFCQIVVTNCGVLVESCDR